MELILYIISIAIITRLGYMWGWEARETRFQKMPITYGVGVQNSIHVDNSGAKTKVTVYNKNLVEIVPETK